MPLRSALLWGWTQDAIDKGWLRLKPSEVGGDADLRIVVEAASQIAAAMRHCHARGLIHGDLTGLLLAFSPSASGLSSLCL